MPLDIDGYNETFRKFAKFAQGEHDAGRHKSIAAAGVKVLKNHRILAVSTAENDEVHKWLRRGAQFSVNDRTRDLFRKSVIDMFGGAAKIPDSVKEAKRIPVREAVFLVFNVNIPPVSQPSEAAQRHSGIPLTPPSRAPDVGARLESRTSQTWGILSLVFRSLCVLPRRVKR